MSKDKKAGRSNGMVRETAEFHIDQEKYNKGYEKVYGEKDERVIKEEKIDPAYYYLNKLFPSDRAVVVAESDDNKVTYKAMINGMENVCSKETFLRYWRISKMRV